VEAAVADGLLARAYLAADDLAAAEPLALRAAQLLGPLQHPEAAAALVTLYLIQWKGTSQASAVLLNDALRLIEDGPLLNRAEKERHLADASARLNHYGLNWDASPAQPQSLRYEANQAILVAS
jgi:hypothetical protein